LMDISARFHTEEVLFGDNYKISTVPQSHKRLRKGAINSKPRTLPTELNNASLERQMRESVALAPIQSLENVSIIDPSLMLGLHGNSGSNLSQMDYL